MNDQRALSNAPMFVSRGKSVLLSDGDAESSLANHLRNPTLVVADQYASGILRMITDVVAGEARVHGPFALEEYLALVARLCRGSGRTLDIVCHTNLATGVPELGGVPFSPLELANRRYRHVLRELQVLSRSDTLARIRFLGCYTAGVRGKVNLLGLSELIGLPVQGTTIALTRGHFQVDGVKDVVRPCLIGFFDPPDSFASSMLESKRMRGGGVPQNFESPAHIAHAWAQTPSFTSNDVEFMATLIADAEPVEFSLEKPAAVVRIEGNGGEPSYGYHLELLSSQLDASARIRFYRSGSPPRVFEALITDAEAVWAWLLRQQHGHVSLF